jgi:hypothetical protein
MWDLLLSRAHLSCSHHERQRDRRGAGLLRSPETEGGAEEVRRTCSSGEGVTDGGGRGQHEHQRSEAHPKTVAARGEVACGLLATEAGGCGRAAPAMAVHGGERGRKTDA